MAGLTVVILTLPWDIAIGSREGVTEKKSVMVVVANIGELPIDHNNQFVGTFARVTHISIIGAAVVMKEKVRADGSNGGVDKKMANSMMEIVGIGESPHLNSLQGDKPIYRTPKTRAIQKQGTNKYVSKTCRKPLQASATETIRLLQPDDSGI